MSNQAVFTGLVVDEFDQAVDVAFVGEEPCYVVNDAGFRRHIPSEQVDRQVLKVLKEMISGHEDQLADQAAKMLGQEDLFTRALIMSQIRNMDKQFDNVMQAGIPENVRAYMGMMGFRVRINVHGEVLEVEQPGMIDPDSGE